MNWLELNGILFRKYVKNLQKTFGEGTAEAEIKVECTPPP